MTTPPPLPRPPAAAPARARPRRLRVGLARPDHPVVPDAIDDPVDLRGTDTDPRHGRRAREVRLALDWTPNTNHTGFYVAQAKGWYADAGIELEVLPYGGTAPEAIVAARQAECGISFQDSMTFAVAAGAPIVSVMAILQHTAQEIAVLDSSPIQRPRDLDGRIYAGFGYPNEVPTLQAVIRADGGTGDFDTVTLDTAAYEALYASAPTS